MNREEAQKRVNEVAAKYDWDRETQREFHDHLQEYHWDTKDELEYSEFMEIAREFNENIE
jgi:hypothetical protein